MMNPISIGLAVAATASLGFANGDGPGKAGDDKPLLDNLWQSGVKVSYKPGSGVTFEGDQGDFKLNISGRIQAKWYYTWLDGGTGGNDTSVSSFRARRARTKFSGHVFNEDVTYYLQLEHTASPNMLDARVGWRFVNNEDSAVNLRVGVQKMRSGLQADNSSANLEFVERSIVSRTFGDNRGTGALLEGGFMKGEDGHKVMWHFGIMNHDTAGGGVTAPAQVNTDSEFMYTLGALFAPEGTKGTEKHVEGDLEHNGKFEPLIGVNFAAGTAPDTVGTNKVQTINIYGSLKTGSGIAAQAEIYLREDEPRGANVTNDSSGWYVQGSYTMEPGEGTQWGAAVRYAMLKFDDANIALAPMGSLSGMGTGYGYQGDVSELTVGINAYYHKHKLKTQLNYVYQDISPDAGFGADLTNSGVDVMFTLLF